jgi:hypothetical protein
MMQKDDPLPLAVCSWIGGYFLSSCVFCLLLGASAWLAVISAVLGTFFTGFAIIGVIALS